ncbi:hypothetical protein LCGC14_0359970 [marine sediment metagenome]|uniref:Uncharacterized protein n=1 Tax=marine sediment metagenome TaxID=412755 RepID=A0A0F9WGG0_9ZZZZ
MAETKYDSWENTSTQSSKTFDDGTEFLQGMVFTASANYAITSIEVFITGTLGTAAVLTGEIYAIDGSDHPTGSALASGTLDVSDLNSVFVWKKVTFSSSYNLTSGTKYAIVLTHSTADNLLWRNAAGGGGYPDGNNVYSSDSGSSWITHTPDQNFKTYGTASTPVDMTYTKKLVAIANDEVWYESSAGTMAELTDANGNINIANPLSMFEAYGKIFIVNQSNLKIADFTNSKLHTTDILPAGVYPRHGTVIEATGGTASGAKMVVDYITDLDGDTYVYGQRITTETFQSGDVCTATIDEGAVSFTLDAAEVIGPHWYSWTTYGNAAKDDTTYGALPNKATIGCLYRGRPTISGNPEYPHQWYMMRQGNPFDALYGINDAQSAVAGHDADVGEIGDIVRALIPYKDDYLVFGCVNTMWLLTGDPAEGGSLNELDLTTGIFGAQSWCFDGEENLWFWGTNGIYKTKIPGKPICMSEIRLPNLIKAEAVNPSTHRISLNYDRRRAGIVIAITTLSDGSNSNYFYDLRTDGFFPESYPEECGVFSMYHYEAVDPDYRKLMVGCQDGYIRIFDEDAADDDIGASDEAIDSYVTFAPMPMSSDPRLTGKLTGLDIVSAGGATGGSQSDSDDIYFKVFTANVAEQIIEKLNADVNPNISGTIKAPGRQRGSSIKRKVKGIYAGIKIGNNTAAETWAFEQLMLDFKPAGRFK